MKKFKTLVFVLVLSLMTFLMAGCGEAKKLEKALANLENQSYKVAMSVDLGSLVYKNDIYVDEKKTKVTMDMMGISVTSYTEEVTVDDKVYVDTYTNASGFGTDGWTYESFQKTENDSSNPMEVFDSIKVDDFKYEDGQYIAEGIDFSDLLGSFDLDELLGDSFAIDFDKVIIKVDGNQIVLFEMCFSVKVEEETMEYTISMKFEDYGNVTVTIPEEAYAEKNK